MSKKKTEKKSNVNCRISQNTYYFNERNAEKEYYGWEETDSHEGATKPVEAASVKEYMNTVLQLAEERGFTLTRVDLTFKKIPSKKLRKEVKFDISCDSTLKELGFRSELDD